MISFHKTAGADTVIASSSTKLLEMATYFNCDSLNCNILQPCGT